MIGDDLINRLSVDVMTSLGPCKKVAREPKKEVSKRYKKGRYNTILVRDTAGKQLNPILSGIHLLSVQTQWAFTGLEQFVVTVNTA